MNLFQLFSNRKLTPVFFPLAILLLVAGGCIDLAPQHDPTRIFVLTGNPSNLPALSKGGAVVRVSPIQLPAYLSSPKMAIRQGGQEIVYSEFNRWGEGLDRAIGQILSESILANPQVSQVALVPAHENLSYDYTVTVNLIRFEGENANAAVLEARWKIIDSESGEIAGSGTTSARRPWDGKDYAALAQGLSDNLAELGQDISRALEDIGNKP